MKVESRFWITEDGKKVFGKGVYQLLNGIRKFGSLNKAAKELNMSYSKAWAIIKRSEEGLKYPLLERKIGGAYGGGSFLTNKAVQFIEAYEKFHNEVEYYIQKLYDKHFKDI